ncbi:MAG: amidohydrolase [Phascolarctobacterium sp.]|nr:MAG: amidohydrolase [Phascolarctobacterium sp.]
MNFKEQALAEEKYILEQRHWLHAHPELGTKEFKTTEHIVNELQKSGIDVQTFDDITGCIGTIKGAYPGKTVMLRADIDALPIQEENECSFCSQNAGVMHACGHDCHTAMLLAAGKMLAAHKDELHGTVKLLFQMAEEIGTESRHYVEKGCLDDVDAIYGQHVWSLVDSGKVSIEDGERMACSDRFTISITGKSAPADKPQDGKDAVLAAANVVMALQSIVSRINVPQNTLVVTTGMMNGGSSEAVVADKVELVGTVRTFNKAFRNGMPQMIEDIAKKAALVYGCEVSSTYFFGPAPLINEHHELNEIARNAAVKIMGEEALCHLDKMTGAEDFSVFMEKTKGVYGFIGVRNLAKGLNCVHHHPKFVVDEDQLKYGAAIYAQFAYDYLNSDVK